MNIQKGVVRQYTFVFAAVVFLMAIFILLPTNQAFANSTINYDVSNEVPTDVAYYYAETNSGDTGHLNSVYYPADKRGNYLVNVGSISANDGIEAWKVSYFSDGKAVFEIQSADGNRIQTMKYASHNCETASWTGPNFWDASGQVFIMYHEVKSSTDTVFAYGYHGNCVDSDAVPISNDPFFINNTGHSLCLYNINEEQYNEVSRQLHMVAQATVPKVILDGTTLSFDVPPTIENGRTLVPLRAIFEAMGAKVSWDDATMTVTAIRGSTTVVLRIESLAPTINGIVKPIDVAGKIVNARTLAPLRFICEAFGGTVDWIGDTQTASIKSADSSQAPSSAQPNPLPVNGVQLTSDYWIPDMSKTYVYATSYDYNSSGPRKGQKTVKWTMDSDGKFLRSWDEYDWQEDGTLEVYGRHEADTYVFKGGSIYWNLNSGWIDQAGSWEESLISGTKEVLRQVSPGQTWSNNFRTSSGFGDPGDSYSETVSFKGMEYIPCLGVTKQAAHINVNGAKISYIGTKNESTYHYNIDYWLIKDIGIAKSVENAYSSGYVSYKQYFSDELVGLPAPGNVLTSHNDNGLATIKWDKVDGAKYYHVYMKDNTNPAEVRVSEDKLSKTICNYQMQLNQECEFRVCAVGPDGKEGTLSSPEKQSYVKQVKVTGVLIYDEETQDILDPNGHISFGHGMYPWDEITMYEQDSMNVSALISPNDASNTKVSWSCSNTSLVKLIPTQPNHCCITTVNLPWNKIISGEYVTVTATTTDGSKKSTITIHVKWGKPLTVDSTTGNQSSVTDSDIDEIVQKTKEYKDNFESAIGPAKKLDKAIQFFGGEGSDLLKYYGKVNYLLEKASDLYDYNAIDQRSDMSEHQKWVEKADLVLKQSAMWSPIKEEWRKEELWNFSNQYFNAGIQAEYKATFAEWRKLGGISSFTTADLDLLNNYEWFGSTSENEAFLANCDEIDKKKAELLSELDRLLEQMKSPYDTY